MYYGTILEMEYKFHQEHLANEVERRRRNGQVYSGQTVAGTMRAWVDKVRVLLKLAMPAIRRVGGGPPIARTPTY